MVETLQPPRFGAGQQPVKPAHSGRRLATAFDYATANHFRAVVFLLLCCIWGSTWLFIKLGLRDLPPVSCAAVRFVLASAVLFGVTIYVPVYTQGVLGSSATSSGVILIPLSLGWVVASIVSGVRLGTEQQAEGAEAVQPVLDEPVARHGEVGGGDVEGPSAVASAMEVSLRCGRAQACARGAVRMIARSTVSFTNACQCASAPGASRSSPRNADSVCRFD